MESLDFRFVWIQKFLKQVQRRKGDYGRSIYDPRVYRVHRVWGLCGLGLMGFRVGLEFS